MAYATGGLIEAAHYNAIIDRFAATFANAGGMPGIARLAPGAVATSAQWAALIQKIADQAAAVGRPFTPPALPVRAKGDLIRPIIIPDLGEVPVLWVSNPGIAYSNTNVFASQTTSMYFPGGVPSVGFSPVFATMPQQINVQQVTKVMRLSDAAIVHSSFSSQSVYTRANTPSLANDGYNLTTNNFVTPSFSHAGLPSGDYLTEVHFVATDPSGRYIGATSGVATTTFHVNRSILPTGPDLRAYRQSSAQWNTFGNDHGIWFLPQENATTVVGADIGITYPLNFPVTGTYRLVYGYDDGMKFTIDQTNFVSEMTGPHHVNESAEGSVQYGVGSIYFDITAGDHVITAIGQNAVHDTVEDTYDWMLNPACLAFVIYRPDGGVLLASGDWADNGIAAAQCPSGYYSYTLPDGAKVCMPI